MDAILDCAGRCAIGPDCNAQPENYFDSTYISKSMTRLDNRHASLLFIHNGHEFVKRIGRKPRNHAGVLHNQLN
jgi:hypothetical protein